MPSGTRKLTMSHHSTLDTRQRLDPYVERAIRLSLRAMGLIALAVCLIFWLSLLLQ